MHLSWHFKKLQQLLGWHLLGLSAHLTCYLHLADQPTYTCCPSSFSLRVGVALSSSFRGYTHTSIYILYISPKARMYLSSRNRKIFALLMRVHALEVCDRSKQAGATAAKAPLSWSLCCCPPNASSRIVSRVGRAYTECQVRGFRS